jgi:hypothetical protein
MSPPTLFGTLEEAIAAREDRDEPRQWEVVWWRHGSYDFALRRIRLAVGDRVEIHPGYDAWMQGDRFGAIEEIEEDKDDRCTVRMDKSDRKLRMPMADLTPTEG